MCTIVPCTQFMNHCMSAGVIELVVFWLDVEHFKHFDGGAEDLKLFAHHIGQCLERDGRKVLVSV